jgi:hypothetical protein
MGEKIVFLKLCKHIFFSFFILLKNEKQYLCTLYKKKCEHQSIA